MSTKSKYDVDLIHLESVTIVNASINNESGQISFDKSHLLKIDHEITTSANIKLKKIKLSFSCDISAHEKKERPLGLTAKFNIAYVFNVENLNELTDVTENKALDVDWDLIAGLSNIVYSTSRGIIYTRCLGTILGNVILPVVSTNRLMSTPANEK